MFSGDVLMDFRRIDATKDGYLSAITAMSNLVVASCETDRFWFECQVLREGVAKTDDGAASLPQPFPH